MSEPTRDPRSPRPPAAGFKSRAAEVAPATLDEESRTVDVIWTTGARVLTGVWDRFYEELSLDPKHVRMERLASGSAPLMDDHPYKRGERGAATVIGVVESARLEKTRGVATVRFAKEDAAADAVWNKVRQGIIRNVSVGYQVHKYEKVEGGDATIATYRAVDWEPFEISAVPMGADAEARFRAEETTMEPTTVPPTTAAPAATANATEERARATAITDLCARHRDLGATFARGLIERGVTLDQARAAVLDELATRGDAFRTQPHHPVTAASARDQELDASRVRLMAEALAARFGGPAPSDEARQYMRLRAVDMAAACLEARGISTRALPASQIVIRGLHSTSDFPALLTETGNRFLRQAYEVYPAGVRRICRQSTAPDFRAKSKIMLGGSSKLEKVNEGGEFKRNSKMAEAKESYSIATYGKIFGLTRQAIVNDDLGAFTDLAARLGRGAGEFENQFLADKLTANPAMSDGVALFHANHNNLAAVGAALSVDSISAAVLAIRTQKDLDTTTPLNVTPKFLLVPAAKETIARQLLATNLYAAKIADTNPYAAGFELVVDARLDASSTTAWYLAADPAAIDTIEYSYLEGEPGPQLESRQGFEVDGLEIRVRLDFGAGVIDYRGLYRNPGA